MVGKPSVPAKAVRQALRSLTRAVDDKGPARLLAPKGSPGKPSPSRSPSLRGRKTPDERGSSRCLNVEINTKVKRRKRRGGALLQVPGGPAKTAVKKPVAAGEERRAEEEEPVPGPRESWQQTFKKLDRKLNL